MSATEYNPCPKCGMPLLLTQPNKCSECGWPAATEQRHGTGSREAKDWFESMPSLSDVPTPASHTVTLDIMAYPGVCSGRPLVGGVPLFTIQGRFLAGESISSIAEDFELSVCSVDNGLRYALENDVNEPALTLLRAAERQK